VEFDGFSEGINAGTTYYPGRIHSIWRKEITELKLRVAFASLFPFFVVGKDQFASLSKNIKLTIVDGIIGQVLAKRASWKKIQHGLVAKEAGISEGAFDQVKPSEQASIIEDWVMGVAVMSDFENNPIIRKVEALESELSGHIQSTRVDPRWFPEITATEASERAREISQVIYHGAKVTLKTRYGNIERTIMLPNFAAPYLGYGPRLAMEIAQLLAMDYLKAEIRGKM